MKQKQRKHRATRYERFQESNVVLVVGVVLLVGLLVVLGRELLRRHDIREQLSSIQDEITMLESRNTELEGLIGYLETPSFQEREARVKLGLQEEGESVIIIPRNEQSDAPIVVQPVTEDETPTAQKWWEYFFRVSDTNRTNDE